MPRVTGRLHRSLWEGSPIAISPLQGKASVCSVLFLAGCYIPRRTNLAFGEILMGTASVLPPSWGEVVEQMRVGVGRHLATIKAPPEPAPSSELPSLGRPMPDFDALEAALRRTEECAQEAENAIQSVADDLAR